MGVFDHSCYEDLVRWLLCNAIDLTLPEGGPNRESFFEKVDSVWERWKDRHAQVLGGKTTPDTPPVLWQSDWIFSQDQTHGYTVSGGPLVPWLFQQAIDYSLRTEPYPDSDEQLEKRFRELANAAWREWQTVEH